MKKRGYQVISQKKRVEIYVADFETSHETIAEKEYAWVWCAGFSRLFNEHIERQGNIADFCSLLMQNRSKKVYFHNLKFDGQFLLSYFFNLGYQYSEYLTKEKQMKYIIDDFEVLYIRTKYAVSDIWIVRYLLFHYLVKIFAII